MCLTKMRRMVTRIKVVFFQCILVGGYLLAQGCEANRPNEMTNDSYQLQPNILNLTGVPDEPTDRSISSFCDLGAWHAYSLPDDPQFNGGFIGPFAMTRDNGIWLGKKFAHISLKYRDGQIVAFSEKAQLDQYPGWLEQILISDDGNIRLNLKLWFLSNRSVVVTASITNNFTDEIELLPIWEGDTWLTDAQYNLENGLDLTYPGTVHHYRFLDGVKIDLANDGKAYRAQHTKTFKIKSGSSVQTGITYSVLFEGESSSATDNISSTELNQSFSDTKTRWTNYHEAFPYSQNHWLDSTSFLLLRSKAIQTLITNWKSAAGELKHDGLFPSYLYQGFHGFWAWDSWKHAVALSRFHPDLAKEQVQAMFDFQNQRGMIADCIFRDTLIENHNWRDSKPPLATWAVSEIFVQTADTSFVKEMFPKIIKYHQWWYNDRDYDGNGLCEYGSTDGTRIAAAWESGMDNAVRFDQAVMVRNNDHAWSLDQESVDLNAYLVLEKKILADLAATLNQPDLADQFSNEAETITREIRSGFYDNTKGYFFDRDIDKQKLIPVFGPEGWIPLWAGVATESQAKSLVKIILNDSIFHSKLPLPTLNISNPGFDPSNGYWRGPVWLDQAYFAIDGLEKYGFKEEAWRLKLEIVTNAEGLLKPGYPIRENYHPITGKGLNAQHFSWSAAHLLLLLEQ